MTSGEFSTSYSFGTFPIDRISENKVRVMNSNSLGDSDWRIKKVNHCLLKYIYYMKGTSH